MQVKVQQPTATAPRNAIPSGPRVAAPTTVTSGTASNGMPTLRQSSAASSLVAAGTQVTMHGQEQVSWDAHTEHPLSHMCVWHVTGLSRCGLAAASKSMRCL